MTPVQAKNASDGDFPSQGIIYDRAGIEVDATGWVWNSLRPEILNFRRLNVQSASLLASIALYLTELVQSVSVDHVTNTFDALVYLHRSEHLRACVENGADIDERLISELRQIPRLAHYRLHYVRAWYRWCAQQKLPQFSPEVAATLDDLVIEHNEQGRAVRTRDPETGAFDELEFIGLTTALRASASSSILDLQERTALWLAIGLGCNPLAYALLREEAPDRADPAHALRASDQKGG
jgi:hypothetical protein